MIFLPFETVDIGNDSHHILYGLASALKIDEKDLLAALDASFLLAQYLPGSFFASEVDGWDLML